MSFQTEIPFDVIIQAFEWMKRKRRAGLAKTGIFTDVELDFLVKITYDITDKDFEYLIAILLEANGFETRVHGGRMDAWIDIIAKKQDTTFAIQCKQWAKARITLKDAGIYYASIFEKRKQYPEFIFSYITTSFIPKDVEEYFRDHGIEGLISNQKIVKECKRLGYFTEAGWKKLIGAIRDRRLKDLFESAQIPLFRDMQDVRKKLITSRLRELKNHLPSVLRLKKSKILAENQMHQQFYKQFFAYWDL